MACACVATRTCTIQSWPLQVRRQISNASDCLEDVCSTLLEWELQNIVKTSTNECNESKRKKMKRKDSSDLYRDSAMICSLGSLDSTFHCDQSSVVMDDVMPSRRMGAVPRPMSLPCFCCDQKAQKDLQTLRSVLELNNIHQLFFKLWLQFSLTKSRQEIKMNQGVAVATDDSLTFNFRWNHSEIEGQSLPMTLA